MALQDVCGLHNPPLFPQWTAPLSRSFMPEDSTHLSGGGIHGEAFSTRLPGRGGLSPLEFYMPIAEYLTESPINFGQTSLSSAPTKLLEIDHLYPSLPSISLPPPTPCPISPSVPLPFTLSHGTTTLGFAFQGGVIAAADTRSSCSGPRRSYPSTLTWSAPPRGHQLTAHSGSAFCLGSSGCTSYDTAAGCQQGALQNCCPTCCIHSKARSCASQPRCVDGMGTTKNTSNHLQRNMQILQPIK